MSAIMLDPPIFGTHKVSGMPVVVLAINWADELQLLYADDDGYLHTDVPEMIRTDWRYNMAEEEWFDAVLQAKQELASDER